ncbi:uncharacterized protein NPIL_428861 [Nephila pilipes]|uniref:Gustatory receptor n=1 Tax=Nephila pilipes TaxID=299642 RepID=A0A8X6NHY9_NEPPI|nr:uncharacterized protein NPIL_428861 [Nephila pilipes]
MLSECDLSGKKNPLIAFFVVMHIVTVIWIIQRIYIMTKMDIYQKMLVKFEIFIGPHYQQLIYFYAFFSAIDFMFYFIKFTVISLFTVYYSLTCRVIRNLIERLLNELNEDCFSEKIDNLLQVYGEITKCMSTMDDELSFLVFLTVLLSMTGIFWRSYRLQFHTSASDEYMISLICSTVIYSLLMIMVLISAAVTNEQANKAINEIKKVPYKIQKQSERIKCILRKDSVQDYRLTLWKIYPIHRSLIITSFGTLLTYGMLIGALGNQL